MKFLFDQNISHRILERLPELFKETTSVKKKIWDVLKLSD